MTKDKDKTREQLSEELKELRRQVAELKTTDNKNSQTEEASYSSRLYEAFMDEAPYSFVLFDSELNYLEVNRHGLQYLPSGVELTDIIGRNLADVVPNVKESGRFDRYMKVIRTGEKFLFEDVVTYPILGDRTFIINAFKVADGMGHIGVDVTELRRAEEQLENALQDKEILLKEIHHRVNNHLYLIDSLLSLQANSVESEFVKTSLMECKNRVYSISAIHELLYQSGNLSCIDMNLYLTKLSRAVAQHYTIRDIVNLVIEASDISIESRIASAVGLIVNELISNSFKHAFADNHKGEIKISLTKVEQNQIKLEYSDNGIGVPKGFDWKRTKSMGLQLVKLLSERQLGGSIDMERMNGTKFTIKFCI
jgi:two-component sensor histidine kinase